MSRRLFVSFVATLVVVLIVIITLTNTGIVSFYKGKLLFATKDLVKIQEDHYVNEYLDLKVAKAEDKYILALSILNPDIIIFFYDGIVKNILTDLTTEPILDELQKLESIQIFIYKKGGLIYSRPIKAFSFGDVNEISKYFTIDEARNALK